MSHDTERFTAPYRHEIKYLLTSQQEAILRTRLPAVMKRDSHVDQNGQYLIRSVYFDDYEDSCLYDNISGVDERTKWRLRCYNLKSDIIFLEAKEKVHGLTRKKSCPITKVQFCQLISNQNICVKSSAKELLLYFDVLRRTRLFQPKVIVQYEREPFVCPAGNVRITIDRNICASQAFEESLSTTMPCRPVLPVGMSLLEVKFDSFLPDYIARTIQMDQLRMTSFSKYYICRMHNYL